MAIVLCALANRLVRMSLLLLVGVELRMFERKSLAVGFAKSYTHFLHFPFLDYNLVLLMFQSCLQLVQVLLITLQLVDFALHCSHFLSLSIQLLQLSQELQVGLLLVPSTGLLNHSQPRLKFLQLFYNSSLSFATCQLVRKILQSGYFFGYEFCMMVECKGICDFEFSFLFIQSSPALIEMFLQLYQLALLSSQHFFDIPQVQLLIFQLY